MTGSASLPPYSGAHGGLPAEVDHVVVGAGAAGCVLAARLSEDPGLRVLLLEAGGTIEGPEFSAPARALGLQAPDAPWFWGDLTTAQGALGGRRVSMLSGKGLGGGSAVNGMMWFRGRPRDFDGWREAGAEGWGWDDVAPVFRSMEHFGLGPDEHHGIGGPMVVSEPRDVSPLSMAFIEAGAERGLAVNPDFNGASLDGVGLAQANTRDGARHSVVDAYLRPALARDNLTVATGTPTGRLLLDGTRVTGVRLADAGGTEVRARRSVVLTAGALRSPQLLMVSGIGPAAHLREVGVGVVSDLPGVGQNLHDHPLVSGLWPVAKCATLPDYQADGPERDYGLLRRGPLASYIQAAAFIRTAEEEPDPDVQLVLAVIPPGTVGVPTPDPIISCTPILLTPRSRGAVRLASSDPTRPPLIDPRYLADEQDRERLVRGLERSRELFETPALRAFSGPALFPPSDADRAALADHVVAQAGSCYHPVGTCRMGTDEGAVVGPDLAVHGIEGLRVADASVMPTVIRGNTQAPTVMIAERAAEMLRSEAAAEGGWVST